MDTPQQYGLRWHSRAEKIDVGRCLDGSSTAACDQRYLPVRFDDAARLGLGQILGGGGEDVALAT